MPYRRTIGLALALAVGLTGVANASVINVSPGTDTIEKALGKAAAGDLLLLAPGSYGNTSTSAKFASDVTVQPENGGAVTTQGWRFLGGASHIVVRGITVTEPDVEDEGFGSAFRVDHGASHVTISDVKVTQGRHGLRIVTEGAAKHNDSPTNVTLRDSEISNVKVDGVQIGGGKDITIDHNEIHDVNVNGLHNDGIQGIRGNGLALTRNTIYFSTAQAGGPNQGIILSRPSGKAGDKDHDLMNVTVAQNSIHTWPGSGIAISGVTTANVVHNTVYDSGAVGTDNTLVFGDAGGTNDGVTLANNIVDKLFIETTATGPATCETNFIASGAPGSCNGTVTTSPLFDSSGTYYLQSGSTAKDAANSKFPPAHKTTDADLLPIDSKLDIGAREWRPLTDTFSGSGTSLLSAHLGENDPDWTHHTVDLGDAEVGGGTAYGKTSDIFTYYADAWTPTDATYSVEGLFVNRVPGSTDFGGLTCRWQSGASKDGYTGRVIGNTLELGKFEASKFTPLHSETLAALGVTLYPGQVFSLKLECGTTKKLLLNGQPYLSSADNAITTAGRPGIRGRGVTLPITAFTVRDL